MRTHENMKRDVPLLSLIWGGYWMAHIACPWGVHILSLSRMAERRSQERRQPIVISRRDNDTLRIALTSGNMCVHGPRALGNAAGRPRRSIVVSASKTALPLPEDAVLGKRRRHPRGPW